MDASYGSTAAQDPPSNPSKGGRAKNPRPKRTPTAIPQTHSHPLSPHLHVLSSCYLRDYERNVCTTLSPEATPTHMKFFGFRQSLFWRTMQKFSFLLLLLSSATETSHLALTGVLSFLGCHLLAMDVFILKYFLYRKDSKSSSSFPSSSYSSRSVAHTEFWLYVVVAFIILHISELVLISQHNTEANPLRDKIVFSSMLKPAVLFYLLPATESALVAFLKVLPSTIKINAYLVTLIFLFSYVASIMYSTADEHFASLFHSFITMFALSTSVNNPACWMALYYKNPYNAIFFVVFLMSTFFFVQKIVLAVILQQYDEMAREMSEIDKAQRDESLALAYQVIARRGGAEIRKDDMLVVLEKVRPHYSPRKLEALWQTLSPNDKFVSFETYKENMPAVMAKSIRTVRPTKRLVHRLLDFFGIVKITIKTLPGIVPPLILLFAALHELCYVGQMLWKGQVDERIAGRGGEFYYLNNFNSYGEGMVCLFNVLVVNDWHQIALVFTERSVGREWVSYTFFIFINLFVVNVLLSNLTAYFVNLYFLQSAQVGSGGGGSGGSYSNKVAPEGGESAPLLIHEKRSDIFYKLLEEEEGANEKKELLELRNEVVLLRSMVIKLENSAL
jgi:hypothetical protein